MELQTRPPEISEESWLEIPPELCDGPAGSGLSKRQAHRWSLVLAARRIPYRDRQHGGRRQLLVASGDFQRALEELRRFEEENRNWPPPLPPETPLVENRLATLSVLILLATFHNLTLLDINLAGHAPVDWSLVGNAHAGKIMRGDWWRLVTALCLHTDWLHLLGNLLIGGVFIVRLCRDLGSGLAWSLLLGSGILGNLLNSMLQHPDHRAVGASTAIFGAVGILAALSLVRYRHNLRRRWPLPIAAALGLLALLGATGERTDLGAHLFGFLCGFGIGFIAENFIGRYGRPGNRLNRILALASAGVVGAAWWAALTFSP
jgi:membrane associated rhomboid family serine protease